MDVGYDVWGMRYVVRCVPLGYGIWSMECGVWQYISCACLINMPLAYRVCIIHPWNQSYLSICCFGRGTGRQCMLYIIREFIIV